MAAVDSTKLPPGPEYREVPDCPGYMAGSDGTLWSCWSKGRWPKRTEIWLQVRHRRNKRTKEADHAGHITVVMRTTGGFRVTEFLHRIILTTFVEPCPDGMIACHDPDPDPTNNAIANLRWATPTENCADCKRHGRNPRGQRHPNAKLRDDDIPIIFQLRHEGLTHSAIAARFGVRQQVITRVLLRLRFTHITIDTPPGPPAMIATNYAKGERHPKSKLNEAKIIEMKKLRSEGWLQKDLARRYEINPCTVSEILSGKYWRHVK